MPSAIWAINARSDQYFGTIHLTNLKVGHTQKVLTTKELSEMSTTRV
jgi:hypothetical protein